MWTLLRTTPGREHTDLKVDPVPRADVDRRSNVLQRRVRARRTNDRLWGDNDDVRHDPSPCVGEGSQRRSSQLARPLLDRVLDMDCSARKNARQDAWHVFCSLLLVERLDDPKHCDFNALSQSVFEAVARGVEVETSASNRAPQQGRFSSARTTAAHPLITARTTVRTSGQPGRPPTRSPRWAAE
jgi:hypothetical protein